MATVELIGRIDISGNLEIEKPKGLHAGRKVKVTITEIDELQDDIAWEEQPWTDEELEELLKPDPKTGAEIVAMIESGELDTSAWVAMNITDPVAWVEEIRRKQDEERERRE